jgi:DNA-binding winged helix-turn-helix (wHTH) protein/tetratricopeptide (TPR) repeat protein
MPPSSAPDVPRLRPFTVGDWLIEPKPCHATHGDTVAKLRPQLVDVLVCLARRAGKIVLKDEILADVWPGQFVAESGLSRCVAELRQALHDDAQEPRYIETIPKRGYRLLAPVVWLQEDPPESVPEPPLPSSSEPGPAPGALEANAPAPAVEPVNHESRHRTWRRAAWAGLAIAMVVTGVTIVGRLARTPAMLLTERDAVLLADVNNTTRDPMFDGTLRLALAVALEQAPFLRILPDGDVRATVARMGQPPDTRVLGPVALDVCRREGGAVLLAASIAPVGSRYAVGIEAIACGSGETVARALVEADGKERVLGALEGAATRIRRKLGETRQSLRQHEVPLERATTPSLEALKALTLGDRNRDQGRLADALTLYRQATELDPLFALAWARRGAVARNLNMRDEMLPAYRRAYELRDRVSQPERFYIEAHYVVDEDPEKAIEIFQAWKRMYPGSYIPPNNLAALLTGQMGRYDEALADAREAVRLAPGSPMAYRTLALSCLGTGRLDEARQVLAAATARGIDDVNMHRLALTITLLDGGRAALENPAALRSGHPMAELDTLRVRASVAMAEGRLREARRIWSEALQSASDVGRGGRLVEIRLFQAQAEALLGDRRAARAALQAVLAADRTPVTLVTAAVVYSLIDEPGRARTLLDEIARHRVPDPGLLRVWLPSARALVEAVEGHTDAATATWRPVARFARGSDFALAPLGVGALIDILERGRPRGSAPCRRPARAYGRRRPLTPLRAVRNLRFDEMCQQRQ